MRRAPVLLLLCAAALPSSGQPPSGLIAVLEFKNLVPAGQVRDELDVTYFSDIVRTESLKAAPGVRVISRENLLMLLGASGKKVEDCEGECEVDTGRRIGADYVVSGELRKVGTSFHLSLRIHDTRSGDLLAGAMASGKSVDELDSSTAQAVHELLAPLRAGAQPAPPVVAERTTPATVPPAPAKAASVPAKAAPAPATAAAAPFEKECDAGDPRACVRAGLSMDRSAKDPARAVAFYRRACDAGEQAGCHDLAVHQHDNGLLRKACDAGAAASCTQLGLALDQGDPAAAAALYQRACDRGDAAGCSDLAVDLRRGLGVAKDEARADQLFKSACASGFALGCWHAKLYLRACTLGLQQACNR